LRHDVAARRRCGSRRSRRLRCDRGPYLVVGQALWTMF
jgi:hypothetical protein